MKPSNWNELSKKTKKEIAINLIQNIRGQYIISQALTKAIDIMNKEKYPESSNIQDMEILHEVLFPLFFEIDKQMIKKLKNKKKDLK